MTNFKLNTQVLAVVIYFDSEITSYLVGVASAVENRLH
jgi:hypothetical protein